MLAPAKRDVTSGKIPKKGVPRDGKIKLFSLRSSATQNEGVCWERANMDPVLDPSGRLKGPIIQIYITPFLRSLQERERQCYWGITCGLSQVAVGI